EQAQVLSTIHLLAERDEACRVLAGTQDNIIDTLQTLLTMLPSLAGEKLDNETASPGRDMPLDAIDELRELKNDVQKFLDEQRRVLDASNRLAKKPVDNFTTGDEQLLRKLTTIEDKWERFLNEAFVDFSKLAQQDFSNLSLLKELLSVRSDVTMAADALNKKAVEIATAFEGNGIENAKELLTNIEKWLPDEPDRTKWVMEDPVSGEDNIEQPELPTELEDLVGDLLEEEEDLFEEMEDLTSKYAMSGDTGIGWDAKDGPISSMNAQGVTGNQLPNSNELSGRSGEGRQGKSSGEFVQSEAVGKGGRRTPTRLTPEPFQKGQINDKSTEPPGGATGGGKISGTGEVGLEGPVPPPLAQELERLAGRQATLISRAERIQTRFKSDDYSNFRFLQAVSRMRRTRNELARYRYHTALRLKKDVLAALYESHRLLGGHIKVQADDSATMPKYIRNSIADAMKGRLSPEFQNVIRQYYRRLEQLGGK
ncbi:MAG: hypothetical protein J7M40_12175, partial [Planctomycetes bacterium]|nr:hypothetical protein [Planctomycetota bacterium]